MRWLALWFVIVASGDAIADTPCIVFEDGPKLARLMLEDAPDVVPQAPVIAGDRIHVDARTAVLRVEREGIEEAIVLPGGKACEVVLAPGRPRCIRVTAYDLAGFASHSAAHCRPAEVIPVMLLSEPIAPPSGPHVLVMIAFVIVLVIGSFVVFAPEIDMGWLRRRATGDTLLPAAARQIARTACQNAIARGFALVAGGTGAIVFASTTLAAFVALAATLLLARQLWVYGRARRMLLLLDDAPTVTLHGDHLVRVRSGSDVSWLVCSQRQLASATEHVLPLARLV